MTAALAGRLHTGSRPSGPPARPDSSRQAASTLASRRVGHGRRRRWWPGSGGGGGEAPPPPRALPGSFMPHGSSP